MDGVVSYSVDSPERLSREDWEDLFLQQRWYGGDVDRSAELMQSAVEGMAWVSQNVQRNLGKIIPIPSIELVAIDNRKKTSRAPMFQSNGKIFISADGLRSAADLDPQVIYMNKDRDNEPTLQGTIDQIYFLIGLEEADHARYWNEHLEEVLPLSLAPQNVSGAAYDAQDHEFEAIQLQLAAAKEKGMSKDTLRVLKCRIEQAKRLRDIMKL